MDNLNYQINFAEQKDSLKIHFGNCEAENLVLFIIAQSIMPFESL